MQLNEFGRIAYDEWAKLPDRFPNMIMDVFQIMPNHMHAIICLETPECESAHRDNIRATARVAPTPDSDSVSPPIDFAPAPTIGDIIGAYRSLVANECLAIYKSRNQNMGKLWQRNYNDHIIRNQHSYRRISNYIINNPADWDNDTFFEG
ncbi:MAG: hypothetical protein LAT84_11190 [Balneolia bacterium]|nr:hypothetical protein [Balneolia bacterium]